MPKSKVRKRASYTAPSVGASAAAGSSKLARPSAPWYPAVMAGLLVLGLAYIVVYYMAGTTVPVMKSIGNYNFAVGFGFLVLGLGMAVRWR